MPLYINSSSVMVPDDIQVEAQPALQIVVDAIETLNLVGRKMCLKECSYRSGRCKTVRYDHENLKCRIYDVESTGVQDTNDDNQITYGEKDIKSVDVSYFERIILNDQGILRLL